MYDLNEKLMKKLEEIKYEILDLHDKKYRYIINSGIKIDETLIELQELNLEMQSASNYYHIIQGFAAGLKYSTNRKSKKNGWYVPDRYAEILIDLIGKEEAEKLSPKN